MILDSGGVVSGIFTAARCFSRTDTPQWVVQLGISNQNRAWPFHLLLNYQQHLSVNHSIAWIYDLITGMSNHRIVRQTRNVLDSHHPKRCFLTFQAAELDSDMHHSIGSTCVKNSFPWDRKKIKVRIVCSHYRLNSASSLVSPLEKPWYSTARMDRQPETRNRIWTW